MTININRFYTTLENRGSILKPRLSDVTKPTYVSGDCNRILKDAIVVVESDGSEERYRLAWLRNPQTTRETQQLLKEYAEIKVAIAETQGKSELKFTAEELWPFASEDQDWYYSAPVTKHRAILASNTGLATAESHGLETADEWAFVYPSGLTFTTKRTLERIIKRQKVFIDHQATPPQAKVGWVFNSCVTQLLHALPKELRQLTFKVKHQNVWYLARFHSLCHGAENIWHRGVPYRFSTPVKLIQLNLEA